MVEVEELGADFVPGVHDVFAENILRDDLEWKKESQERVQKDENKKRTSSSRDVATSISSFSASNFG